MVSDIPHPRQCVQSETVCSRTHSALPRPRRGVSSLGNPPSLLGCDCSLRKWTLPWTVSGYLHCNMRGSDTKQMQARMMRRVAHAHFLTGGLSLDAACRLTERVAEATRRSTLAQGAVGSVFDSSQACQWKWTKFAGQFCTRMCI
jgi:hypothetical protein